MKNKNLQGGFAPLLIIAIIAILAIGAGAYVVQKNRAAKAPEAGDNLNTQANVNADLNANANANLGINANAKSSLRSLLGLGKNVMCTFSGTTGSTSSSGTVYISADGSMRGDFTTQTSTGTQTSSMIVKDKIAYAWSGTQGVKMDATKATTSAGTSAQAKSAVDLDSQVDHKCTDWTPDASKFVIPATVKFLDLEAMMKASTGANGKLSLPAKW